MNYKEVDFLIESYVNYFNFLIRANISYYKKKRIQEVEIRKTEEKNDNIKLISFYLGRVKEGVDVRFFEISSMELLTELKKEGFIETANIDALRNSFNINNIDNVRTFFKVLENTKYFLVKTYRIEKM